MQPVARSALVVLLAVIGPTLGCEPDVKAPPPPPPTSVALFDPLATPAVVPTPNDLAFTGGDGTHLNPPDTPGESAAQASLNAYLRRLNGFPASSTPTTTFSAPLDPASATLTTAMGAGSVVLVDTTAASLVGSVMPTLSADGKTLELVPSTPFEPGHRYAVVLFGGSDPAGLRGATGEQVIASPSFFFLRSPNPLVARCGDASNPECACPQAAVSDPGDTSCHSIVLGLSDAAAKQAEPQRQQLQAALAQLLPLAAPGRDQTNVVLFWTFTISTQPFTVFNPTTGDIPLPNDLLIDQTTHLVNLPIMAGDPLAPIKMQLNTLDGFSVQAPETIGVEGPSPVDATTLVANRSVFFLNLTPQVLTPQPEYTVTTAFGQIVLVPTAPLISDQNRYAVVITTGVADQSGQALLPPAPVWLTTGPDPLFDGTHSTVSALTDDQAQQLEALRMAEQPLVTQLAALGISRASIAGLWTFTTQSIQRPNGALAAFPATAMLPTDVTLQKVADQGAIASAFGASNFLTHVKYLVLGRFTSKAVIDPATGLIDFTRTMTGDFSVQPPANAVSTTIRFWLALPNATGPVPVAFVQHGLTSWRGDMLPLADPLAQQGWASVGFDIDFHGARSRCTADNQCAAGTCDTATGVCSGGFAPATGTLACDIAAVSGDTSDCKPAISGQGYIDVKNVFSWRDNGQQYIVDAAQLLRVLSDTTNASGLAAQLAAQTPLAVTPTLDSTKVGLLGMSLGGFDGSLFLAASPRPSVGVLNVTGGRMFDILATSPAFSPVLDQFLQALGVQKGTAEYAQVAATVTWALDAADPWSVAPGLRDKPVIVQEAGMDMTIPPPTEEALALAIFGPMGVDAMHHAQGKKNDGTFVSTYFPTASHSELLTGSATGLAEVAQAIGFLISFGGALPTP